MNKVNTTVSVITDYVYYLNGTLCPFEFNSIEKQFIIKLKSKSKAFRTEAYVWCESVAFEGVCIVPFSKQRGKKT